MPKRRTRVCADGIHVASTQELIDEIQRRSLGCMVVSLRADERGDQWTYALKGSPILMGAMSAALSMKMNETLSKA
jgi:hypothetical protein